MKKLRLFDVACACLLFSVFSPAALATTVQYNYTGFTFDTNDATNPLCTIGAADCFTHVTASFELSTALGTNMAATTITPDAWSISDGLTTITDQTVDFFLFTLLIGTDASGNIDRWRFLAANSALSLGEVSQIETTFNASLPTIDDARYCTVGTTSSCSFVAVASLSSNPGSWTVVTTPLPATAWLFASGLLGLLGISRRRRMS